MELNNRVVLITGGARMGSAIAERFAQRGADLALVYRNSRKNAEAAAKSVRSKGRRALLIRSDLTNESDVTKTIRMVKSKYGRLDILVHMASIYEDAPISKLSRRHWDDNMEVNLASAYRLSLKAAPLMKKHGGRVIFVTDWTVESGRPRYKNMVPYYVSKSGLRGLTEVLALELAPTILVNAIAPGPILPPKGSSARSIRAVTKVTPLGRWGGPHEIAKAAEFLVDSNFVTGECIRVDGGRHLY